MASVVATARNSAGLSATKAAEIAVATPPPPPPAIGYMTPAAAAELPKLLSGAQAYPPPWVWDASKTAGTQPRAAILADNLTPRIEHWRGGVLLATYASFGTDPAKGRNAWPSPSAASPSSSPAYVAKAAALGAGPFGDATQIDLYRLWQEGDEFHVFPAVYTGPANNLLIMPRYDGFGNSVLPKNLTIIGITVNGIRPVIYCDAGNVADFGSAQGPVYLWQAENITIENIDVAKGPKAVVGKSGVYLNSVTNVTFRQMRVHGFADHSATLYGENGIISSNNGKGTLTLDQVELFDNGGSDGPGHNAYIGDGADPSFTLHAKNCWFHGATVGHLFKTRAQISLFEGCYFEGGLPRSWPNQAGGSVVQQADNWMLDCPNGGKLTVRNCIFLKQQSGPNSNGAAITWGVEGIVDARALSIDIQHCTFVTLTATYDGAHPVWPMIFRRFQWPVGGTLLLAEQPNNPIPVIISRNAFVGYPARGGANIFMNYRGENPVTAAFSEISQDFSLSVKMAPDDTGTGDAIIGTPAYAHEAQSGVVRAAVSVGAVD